MSRKRSQKSNIIELYKPIKKNNFSAKKKASLLATCLFMTFILLLSMNGNLFHISFLPTWDDLYHTTGLAQESIKVTADISVHFIDVGQGDCELIKTKNTAVLIDAGEKDNYEKVINYIKSQGISRLDYVIVTHPHSDHAGSMQYVLNEFDIGTVILPQITEDLLPTTATYINMLGVISEKSIDVMYAKPGTVLQLDESSLSIIAPVGVYEDLNDWSVVVKFVHGENSFLFTGDIEEQAEDDILDAGYDISADVLKVAHHGSSTSSKKKFLTAVNPRYAVIEVGSPNSYNHPNEKVLERLQSFDVDIYRTDINGDIVFESDGKEINVITEKTVGANAA